MLKPSPKTLAFPRKQTSIYPSNINDERLHFSELRYRRLFETAQDGILILHADTGKIADSNPFLQKLLGYTQAELLGKELWQIGLFKDAKDSKAAFQELQEKGYIRYNDLPLQTKTGSKIEVEFVSNVYMVDTEKVIQCNIRDITSRRKIEQAVKSKTEDLVQLNKSQEETKKAMLNVMEDLGEAKALIEVEKVKDEAMLASIADGLIAVNSQRKIMIVNKSAEKMLGWKMKDMIGKEISSLPLVDEDGRTVPINKRPTQVALITGKNISTNYFFARKDGTRFPIAIQVTPIKLGGKIIGALDIFRDITREKEIDKAKSEFVSLASHQLRTPLGIIKWYLEALRNDPYFNKSPLLIQKYYNEIYKSNERVLSLVRDLLSVSRIDQGRIRNAPKSTNVITTIRQIVAQMRIIAIKKGVDLRLKVEDPSIPLIDIDILRLHEAVENVIVNAIEYSKSSDRVDIILSQTRGNILIKVHDQGIGISELDQKKLFTKFFRAKNAIGHNPEGSGLGLYVVKSYVEGWGGTVTAQSQEGRGSIFTISLPINQKHNPSRASG